MDYTVSFLPGSRRGPGAIRDASYALEEYSLRLAGSLDDKIFYDAGDIDLPIGNVNKSLDMIKDVANSLFGKNKLPIFIGGEHLISYPLVSAAYEHFKNIVLLHFDAHADLRKDYIGERLSHATVIGLLAHETKIPIYQFGIRSGAKEEFIYAKSRTSLNPYKALEPFKEVIPSIKERPIYVTFDIDVIDPAFAPGTGTPEPGGITSGEALEIMYSLSEINVIGMDIVEVSPMHDVSSRTALLAAKMIREFIISKG